MNVLVIGSQGRLGQKVSQKIRETTGMKLFEMVRKKSKDSECLTFQDLPKQDYIVFDASSVEKLNDTLSWLSQNPCPYVLAVTGFDEGQREKLKQLSAQMPILISSNLSVKINLLLKSLLMVSPFLNGVKIVIEEVHHVQKKDKPSGTALWISNQLNKALPRIRKVIFLDQWPSTLDDSTIYIVSHRQDAELGQHVISIFDQDEKIQFSHQAFDRSVFSKGAIEAMRFICLQKNGLYDMQDVFKKEQ